MVLANHTMVLTHGFPRLMNHCSHLCERLGWLWYYDIIYYWVKQPMVLTCWMKQTMVLTHGIVKSHGIS